LFFLFFFLSEHARYVYNLQQEPDSAPSDDSDDSELWSSDDAASASAARARRKRMSILTNRYVDAPQLVTRTAHAKRRFFQSAARWDEGLERVLVGPRLAELNGVMEKGGREAGEVDESNVDVDGDDWDMD
jgi:histone deacetylase 1/2